MYVVMGATGQTGSVVATSLLAQGKAVRVVVRNAAKGKDWAAKGAEVAIADVTNSAALARAFEGAVGAYVMLPPDVGVARLREEFAERSKSMAAALAKARVAHAVLLSSIGAELSEGTGPVITTHDAESILRGAAGIGALSVLRPSYFMENLGAVVGAARQGVFPTFLREDKAVAMVATHDIGLAATRLLVEGGDGHRIVQLEGPRSYAPADVAASFSRALGTPVALRAMPDAKMAEALVAQGMPAPFAKLLEEMTQSLNAGRMVAHTNLPTWRGDTELDAVIRALVTGAGPSRAH